jgi:integrase/recombinase XerD
VTRLRKLMLDELQRRNYAQNTVRAYIHAIEDFAKYFHRSPDRLGPEHIREYQVHLFRDCKLSPGTIEGRTAALRFLFVKTLRRPYLPDHIPFPKRQRRMPTVLSQEEVARLIASAQNLMHRTMLMMLYATGLRRAELCHLKVCDIDSERMVIHVRQGKGGRDRDVLLTPKLLDTLREYWRWMKPKTYLFPGTVNKLAGGRAHHREDCLEGRGGGRETCWGEQACVSSHAPAQFRHPHARSRRRSAHDPGFAGSCQTRRHHGLPALVPATSASSSQPSGSNRGV